MKFFKANWRHCMNTRDIANEYHLGHWTQVLQKRTDSGLTIRAYCKETGIHENTNFYW
jgi:putative transposase